MCVRKSWGLKNWKQFLVLNPLDQIVINSYKLKNSPSPVLITYWIRAVRRKHGFPRRNCTREYRVVKMINHTRHTERSYALRCREERRFGGSWRLNDVNMVIATDGCYNRPNRSVANVPIIILLLPVSGRFRDTSGRSVTYRFFVFPSSIVNVVWEIFVTHATGWYAHYTPGNRYSFVRQPYKRTLQTGINARRAGRTRCSNNRSNLERGGGRGL